MSHRMHWSQVRDKLPPVELFKRDFCIIKISDLKIQIWLSRMSQRGLALLLLFTARSSKVKRKLVVSTQGMLKMTCEMIIIWPRQLRRLVLTLHRDSIDENYIVFEFRIHFFVTMFVVTFFISLNSDKSFSSRLFAK